MSIFDRNIGRNTGRALPKGSTLRDLLCVTEVGIPWMGNVLPVLENSMSGSELAVSDSLTSKSDSGIVSGSLTSKSDSVIDISACRISKSGGGISISGSVIPNSGNWFSIGVKELISRVNSWAVTVHVITSRNSSGNHMAVNRALLMEMFSMSVSNTLEFLLG